MPVKAGYPHSTPPRATAFAVLQQRRPPPVHITSADLLEALAEGVGQLHSGLSWPRGGFLRFTGIYARTLSTNASAPISQLPRSALLLLHFGQLTDIAEIENHIPILLNAKPDVAHVSRDIKG
jgi:hypothetical protein